MGPIGSYPGTPAADLLAASRPAPWGDDVELMQSGRQALRAVADSLWAAGRRALLVPAFLCDSMIDPFLHHPWRLVWVPVDDRFELDLDALVVAGDSVGEPFVALVGLYFGALPDDAYRAAVARLRAAGGVVVDDETHRVFEPGGSGADLAVASVRKLLPVADGAYLRGDLPGTSLAAPAQHGVWEAMDAVAADPAGDEPRARLRDAVAVLEEQTLPAEPHPRTREILGVLDLDELARRRRENAVALTALLRVTGTDVVAPRGVVTPAFVLVRLGDAVHAQRALAERGVFCPVHWLRPAARPDGRWPDLAVSLPVDHRYDAGDMVRIARAVAEVSP